MSDLFWPGDERAGTLLTEQAWLDAMVDVEQAWLDALAGAGVAAGSASLTGLVDADDLDALAAGAESGGNPVLGLVRLLRERADAPGAAWVHRGLTSQDVVDTALVLALGEALAVVRGELRTQVEALAALADAHRGTLMAGRTLTQHAVPTTFGLKAAGWLAGVLDAAERVDALVLPVQLGGAAGTLSAATELAGDLDLARRIVTETAAQLGLADAAPWHTTRTPVVAIGEALVGCTDAWGRIAADVTTLSRPEIGELAEPSGTGRGGSSTMPHKQNPVLSVLVRRAAIAAPQLGATLHLAAALAVDERPDGAWHAEWATLRTLGRRTVVAASQTTELVSGLRVDAEAMAATARRAWDDLAAERDAIASFAQAPPSEGDYLGAAGPLVDAALRRAHDYLEYPS